MFSAICGIGLIVAAPGALTANESGPDGETCPAGDPDCGIVAGERGPGKESVGPVANAPVLPAGAKDGGRVAGGSLVAGAPGTGTMGAWGAGREGEAPALPMNLSYNGPIIGQARPAARTRRPTLRRRNIGRYVCDAILRAGAPQPPIPVFLASPFSAQIPL